MQISPAKAVRLYKISKPTLYADMKSGKLSFTKSHRGKRQIDTAELSRLYDLREKGQGAGDPENVKNGKGLTELNGSVETKSVKYEALLETKLNNAEKLLEEVKAQRDQLIQDKEKIQGQLDKALEIGAPIGRLLEDQRKEQGRSDTETQAKLKNLEETNTILQEQVKRFMKREKERRMRQERLRQEREMQRNKKRGIWSILKKTV